MTLPYEIDFEDRKDFAYARISAHAIDRSMAFAYLAEVVMKCAEHRQKKLLLVRDIPAVMSDEDMIAALRSLLSMGSGMKIAIVNAQPGLGKNLREIVNAECADRDDCSYFEDLAEAERWLLAEGGISSINPIK